jgi:hypothetical protein
MALRIWENYAKRWLDVLLKCLFLVVILPRSSDRTLY